MGNGLPLVSVVIPVYNCERYVLSALESIVNQSYKNIEIIVVDDKSTDNSLKIIKSVSSKDKRVVVLELPKNCGVSGARNKGIVVSRGEYYASMDADDIAVPSRIEKQVAFLEGNPNIAFVGLQIQIIDESGRIIGNRNYPTNIKDVYKRILLGNPFPGPGLLIRNSVLKELGGYNENLPVCEDYDLCLRLLRNSNGLNLKDSLLLYRLHKGQSKITRLKLQLWLTMKLQIKNLFNQQFFSIGALLLLVGKAFLIIVPSSLIYKLFKAKLIRK